MLNRGIVALCFLLLLSSGTFGQETSGSSQPQRSSSSTLHDSDVPVHDTETERAEAKEAEAREEALKSLFVHGRYTFLPLPALAYDRNESYWAGTVMPILQSNTKDELQNIYAPFYTHNRYAGETVGLHYYGYPSDTEQYSATASYSTNVQRDIDLTYKNVGAWGGRYILAARATWFQNPFQRLFGIGNQTSENEETNYTSREGLVDLTLGIHLNDDIALMWTEHFHDFRIDQGIIESLPQTTTRFSQLDGMTGSRIVGHKLTLRYDTRDKQLITTRGTYATMSVELSQNLSRSATNPWVRVTLDARHLFPHYHDRLVFVARFFADTVNGTHIPFYERPTLGGETTLRGFGLSRFIDNTALLINLEERIRIRQVQILDYLLDLEVAPFLDAGRVMSGFNLRDFKSFQVNPGVGLRIIAQPHVVGRFDIAYGRDGINFFLGLDYPF